MPARPEDLIHARNVEWQTVSSSNVHSALFSQDNDLYVRYFRSGPDDIYVYPDRSPEEWQDFLTATSKGGWIWDNPIAENWSYDLLTTRAFRDVSRAELAPGVRDFLERT